MKYITAKTDYGEKETFEKWNGKFYSEKDLDEIITVTEPTTIFRPDATLEGKGIPIAYVIPDVFPNDDIRNILYEIEETSVMRANAAGPIDKEEMEKKDSMIVLEIELFFRSLIMRIILLLLVVVYYLILKVKKMLRNILILLKH